MVYSQFYHKKSFNIQPFINMYSFYDIYANGVISQLLKQITAVAATVIVG
jgi:hypothetical protein